MYLHELELFKILNLGLSQSWNMQKLNQNGYQTGGYSSAVAKQLHASKSVEFKQWKGSNFPGHWFQRQRTYLRGPLDVRAETWTLICVCYCVDVCVQTRFEEVWIFSYRGEKCIFIAKLTTSLLTFYSPPLAFSVTFCRSLNRTPGLHTLPYQRASLVLNQW